jgi:hypothetical protein
MVVVRCNDGLLFPGYVVSEAWCVPSLDLPPTPRLNAKKYQAQVFTNHAAVLCYRPYSVGVYKIQINTYSRRLNLCACRRGMVVLWLVRSTPIEMRVVNCERRSPSAFKRSIALNGYQLFGRLSTPNRHNNVPTLT